jgi:hypothetical protein
MFVTANNFDAAVALAAQSKKFTRRDRTSLQMLRRQLFSLTF